MRTTLLIIAALVQIGLIAGTFIFHQQPTHFAIYNSIVLWIIALSFKKSKK